MRHDGYGAAAEVRSVNSAPSYDVRRTVRSSIVTPLLLTPIIPNTRREAKAGLEQKVTKTGERLEIGY